MSSFLEKECKLKFFTNNDFIRKKCKLCGDFFWTLNKDVDICGDKPCRDFSFINNPLGKKKLSIRDVRNHFLDYFVKVTYVLYSVRVLLHKHSYLCHLETF